MLNSTIIAGYLELQDFPEETKVMKRTRATTRKFIEDHKADLKNISIKIDHQIAFYELNGKKHQVKLQDETIVSVSCDDCSGESFDLIHVLCC